MTTSKKKEKKPVIKKEKDLVGETDKKIKVSNYLLLGVIFLIALLIVIAFRNWYISYESYQLTIPILKNKLNEVTVAELDNYIMEHDDAIIYIEVSEEENSRTVAKDLIDVVKNRDLTERIIYLNISSVEDKDAFFAEFSDKYMEDERLEYYPALLLFYEGKVEAYVSRTKTQRLNIGDVEQLFDAYELEG